MNAPHDPILRRVGFRTGTDAELLALHAVEAPIAAERGSTRMPKNAHSYIELARNLPPQFDDHAWLVETSERAPIAAAFAWSNAAGDPRLMECDVLVRHDFRRQGLGRRLLATICRLALHGGRSLLTWSTFDPVPAGADFSQRFGARPARTNRISELRLADLDWAAIEKWRAPERARSSGYTMDLVEGVFPANLRGDAAAFHHIMQTAPQEGLDAAEVAIDEDFVAALDRALVAAGRTRWTLLVRSVDGTCIGGTEITFEPSEPEVVQQQNTGIHPAHRGSGLAKWAKAEMLDRLRRERPEVRFVRTDNAGSNAPMLAINAALGFRIVSARTEWQAQTEDLLRALGDGTADTALR